MAPPYVSVHLQSSARLAKPKKSVGMVDWSSIFPASQTTTTAPAHHGHVSVRTKVIEKDQKKFSKCFVTKELFTGALGERKSSVACHGARSQI